MKRFFYLLAFFLLCTNVNAQSKSTIHINLSSSVLIPMEIYVGDLAELRCFLETQLLLLPEDQSHDSIQIEYDISDATDFSIVKLELSKAEGGYDLRIFFIPWKPGNLTLPDIDMKVFPSVAKIIQNSNPVILTLPSVEVASIAAKLQETSLRKPAAPLLIPGTIYVVYGIILVFIILLILLIIIWVKFRNISFFFKNIAIRLRFLKNCRKIIKRLKKLERKACSHKEFAEILSKIIKDYLFKRFGISFSSSTTTEIPVLFEEIFAGTLSNEQQDGIDKICGILHRCDYIRYAPQAKMEPEERFSIIALTKEIIFSFEKEIS